jgi:hypothetical protein
MIFNVGDKVYLTVDTIFDETFSIDIIKTITPSGQIKLTKHEGKFRDNGNEIQSGYHGSTIQLLTPELRKVYDLWRMRRHIKDINWNDVIDEKIVLVHEIVYNSLKKG